MTPHRQNMQSWGGALKLSTYFSSAARRDSSPEIIRSLSLPFSPGVTRPDLSKSDTERSRPDKDDERTPLFRLRSIEPAPAKPELPTEPAIAPPPLPTDPGMGWAPDKLPPDPFLPITL